MRRVSRRATARDARPLSTEDPGEPAAAEDSGALAGYRLLRRIATGERAQVYLAIATPSNERGATAGTTPLVVVRVYDPTVEASAIADELAAMEHVSALPRALDVATLGDGRICIVVERCSGTSLIDRLALGGLTIGEAITTLAPIAVAIEELTAHGFAVERLAAADVQFDGTGRPRLLAAGALRRLPGAGGGAPGARIAAVRGSYGAFGTLVDEVATGVRPLGALDGLRRLIGERMEERPFVPFSLDAERALFALARPAPVQGIRIDALGPAAAPARPTGLLGAPEAFRPHPERVVANPVEPARRAAGWRRFLGGPGIRDIVEAIDPEEETRARTSRFSSRLGRFVAPRRSALLFGVLAGGSVLVLMLTLVPPGPDASHGAPTRAASAPSSTGQPPTPPPGSSTPEATPEAVPNGTSGADETPTAALEAVAVLLEDRATCYAELDLACLEAVVQVGSGLDAVDRAAVLAAMNGAEVADVDGFATDRTTIIGRMGAAWLAAVPYRDAEREPASVLMMRTEAGWRLREIFD